MGIDASAWDSESLTGESPPNSIQPKAEASSSVVDNPKILARVSTQEQQDCNKGKNLSNLSRNGEIIGPLDCPSMFSKLGLKAVIY